MTWNTLTKTMLATLTLLLLPTAQGANWVNGPFGVSNPYDLTDPEFLLETMDEAGGDGVRDVEYLLQPPVVIQYDIDLQRLLHTLTDSAHCGFKPIGEGEPGVDADVSDGHVVVFVGDGVPLGPAEGVLPVRVEAEEPGHGADAGACSPEGPRCMEQSQQCVETMIGE